MTQRTPVGHIPFRKQLILTAIVAVTLRLIWWLCVWTSGSNGFVLFDSPQYILLAENLLEHGEFSRSEAAPFFPDIARTPGYPLFLIPFFKLGIAIHWIALTQILLSAAIPLLVLDIARKLELKGRWIAAIIPSIDLSLLLFAPVILSDSLFILLLTWWIWWMVSKEGKQRLWGALILGLVILVRPIAQFIPFLLLGWMIWSKFPKKQILAYFLIAMFLPGFWIARNYQQFEAATLSSMGLNNLMLYNAAGAEAAATGVPFTEVQQKYVTAALEAQDWYGDPLATKKYLSWMRENALDVLAEYPSTVAYQSAKSLGLYFFKPPRSYFDQQFNWDYSYDPILGYDENSASIFSQITGKTSTGGIVLMFLQAFINLATFLLGVLGIRTLWKKHRQWTMLFILLILYFWFLSVFTQTDARFRLPVIPLLALFAAAKGFPRLTRRV